MHEMEFYLILVDFFNPFIRQEVKDRPYQYILVSLGEEEAMYKAKKLLEEEKGHPIGDYTKLTVKRISNQEVLRALNW